jgi:hypothetical protein
MLFFCQNVHKKGTREIEITIRRRNVFGFLFSGIEKKLFLRISFFGAFSFRCSFICPGGLGTNASSRAFDFTRFFDIKLKISPVSMDGF